jgi:uncharacterized protein YjbJ (UPF0337 family)
MKIMEGDQIMGKYNKAGNMKDKMEGKINEKVGKAIGNEKMEMKGKIQTAQAEVKQDIHTIEKNLKEKIKEIEKE